MLDIDEAREGFAGIAEKVATQDMIGLVWVRQFVEGTPALGERTPEQWQLGAVGPVQARRLAIGLAE